MRSTRTAATLAEAPCECAAECVGAYRWEACSTNGGECTSSKCCDDEDYACYKRPYAHYAQCRRKEESCSDTSAWLCPGSEGRSVGMGSWEQCSDPWQKCLESGCCTAHAFGCFKRVGAEYAQCRPLESQLVEHIVTTTVTAAAAADSGVPDGDGGDVVDGDGGGEKTHTVRRCVDSDAWRCPGWQLCSEQFNDCMESRCCGDEPLLTQYTMPHAVHHASRSALAPTIHIPACSRTSSSQNAYRLLSALHVAVLRACCPPLAGDDGFGCFKRPWLHFAQCRDIETERRSMAAQGKSCGDEGSEWLCPGSWEQCSGADDDCTSTRCCSNTGFACYSRHWGGAEAKCLREGECQMPYCASYMHLHLHCSHSGPTKWSNSLMHRVLSERIAESAALHQLSCACALCALAALRWLQASAALTGRTARALCSFPRIWRTQAGIVAEEGASTWTH